MDLKEQIDDNRLPLHIAVIMDGNGRWAKMRGKPRIYGHEHGVKSVREISEAAAELGVKYLTLYAFSTENWKRPKLEVDALMGLLLKSIKSETKTLLKNDIQLQTIGNTKLLGQKCYNELNEAKEKTANNKRMTLILALSYSARWELVQTMQKIARQIKNNEIDIDAINDELIAKHLYTAPYPDPELLIRTSGESRISNFLLWQIAYTELYFTPVLWPDFRKKHLYEAILDYQIRERRFGKISEQINQDQCK